MSVTVQNDALVRVLVSDFDVYRRATRWWHEELTMKKRGGVPVPPIDVDKHVKPMAAVLAFCTKHGVEPRAWLYSVFAQRGWQYPVGIDKLTPVTHLAKFQKNKHRMGFFRQRLESKAVGDEVLDPNRDLIPSVESRKYAFAIAGQSAQCRKEILLTTLGFHPKSSTCLACPEKVQCTLEMQQAMPFPVLLLRTGQITIEQAKAIATGAK